MTMHFDVVSIFPEYLEPLKLSLVGKAIDDELISLRVWDLRDFTHDRHRTVDDTPYGGGPGMVMKPEPWGEALDAILAAPPAADATPQFVVPTPGGKRFSQSVAQGMADGNWFIFACGRYEGIDARVTEYAKTLMPVHELTIGDYVLAGGEAAVLVIVEAVARLIPGVLGNAESAVDDSFAIDPDLVEGPAYTKPAEWRGFEVPEILLSGHHGNIAKWRREEAELRTSINRPDLRP